MTKDSVASTTGVSIEDDSLRLGPVRVYFQRTLRIPEKGLHYLPPGMGRFPLRRVDDYPDTVPAGWLARGGVMLPIYQREAMWLAFSTREPAAALQVGIGEVCAVSGEQWSPELVREPQNYVALPEQLWLDGINSGEGQIRQFVAVPLGLGATVEAQVTGVEVRGGIQLRAVGLTDAGLAAARREEAARAEAERELVYALEASGAPLMDSPWPSPMPPPTGAPMGLGAGGSMRQEIYEDPRPVTDYDPERSWEVVVHLCSADQWTAITGEKAPSTPVDRDAYVERGFPWFDYYDADNKDLDAPEVFDGVESVGKVLGEKAPPFEPVDPKTVITINGKTTDEVGKPA